MAKDKRSKPQLETIKVINLSEADRLLRQISDINAKLRGLESAVDIAMNELKEDMRMTAEPMIEEKERLEKSLAIYAEYNKRELFGDKKTIELTFGLFGYRQSTSIGVKASTVELLKKHGFFEAVVLKETPNKEVMRDWSIERLGLVDNTIETKKNLVDSIKEVLKSLRLGDEKEEIEKKEIIKMDEAQVKETIGTAIAEVNTKIEALATELKEALAGVKVELGKSKQNNELSVLKSNTGGIL